MPSVEKGYMKDLKPLRVEYHDHSVSEKINGSVNEGCDRVEPYPNIIWLEAWIEKDKNTNGEKGGKPPFGIPE